MAKSSSTITKSARVPSGRSSPTAVPVRPASMEGEDQVSTSVLVHVDFPADSSFEVPSFPPHETIYRSIIGHTHRDDHGFNAATRRPDGFTRSSLQVYQTFRRDRRRTGRSPVDRAVSVSCQSSGNQEDQITIVTLRNVWRLYRYSNIDDGGIRISREDNVLSAAPQFTIPVQEFNPDCSSKLVINMH